MGYPLSQRINNLITHLGEYEKVLDLERGFFAQCIEWGRDNALFGEVFEARKFLFVSPSTAFADGTNIPADWLGFIRASSTSSPTGKAFTWIQPNKLPGVKRTGMLQATVNSPKVWQSDKKLHVWPNTVTGNMFYYRMPVKLYFDDQTTIDETVTDTMPTDSEPLIEASAWEYAVMQLIAMKDMGKLVDMKAQAVSALEERFFKDMTRGLNPIPTNQPTQSL